jgi:hypothetical protein
MRRVQLPVACRSGQFLYSLGRKPAFKGGLPTAFSSITNVGMSI